MNTRTNTRNSATTSTTSKKKENTMNTTTITLTNAQIEALTQLLAIASAQNAQSAPVKATKSAKSVKTIKTTKTDKSARKSHAPKKVEKPALALVVSDDGKAVSFNQYASHVIWASNDKLAQSLNGAYDRETRAWQFKSKQSAQKFVKSAVLNMGADDYAEAKAQLSIERKSAPSKRSAEEVQSYKDAYAEMWNAWVADCEAKGIKRTSQMNKAASADIRGTLASRR